MNTQEVKSNILNTIQTNTTGNITGNILQQVLMNMMTVTDITFGSTDNIQYLKLDNIENSQVKLLSIGNAATDIELKYDSGVKFYAANTLMMEVADNGIYINNYMDTKDISVDGDIILAHNKVIKDNTNQATNYIKFTGIAANPTCEIKTNILNVVSNSINMANISIFNNTSTQETTIGKQGLNIIFDSNTQNVELQLQSDYDIKSNANHDIELNADNDIRLNGDNDIELYANKIKLSSNNIDINVTNYFKICESASTNTYIELDNSTDTINIKSDDFLNIVRPHPDNNTKVYGLTINEDGIGLLDTYTNQHISIGTDSGHPGVFINGSEFIELKVGNVTLALDDTKLNKLITLLNS